MTCAICSQPLCGHSDLEFAGLVPPRHSPVTVRAGACSPSAGPEHDTVPAPFEQPPTGSACWRKHGAAKHHHQKDQASSGNSGSFIDANDGEASQHIAAQYMEKYVDTSGLTTILDPVIVRDGDRMGVWL